MRKSVLLLPPYSNLHCSSIPLNRSKPTSQNPSPKINRYHQRARASTNSDARSADLGKEHCWPDLPHPTAVPTPYQIFHIKRGEHYTKHRFYQLVKLYHPDRLRNNECLDHISALPGMVKIERYRLIVAAHEILSDPARRKAYDMTGTGWGGQPNHDHAPYYSTAWRNSKWSGFDTNDSPYYNATWEDWEKWYHRGETKSQHTVYTSNSGFLTIVVSAVFLGAYGQSLLIEQHDSTFKTQIRQTNDHASFQLRSRREASQDLVKNDRVKHFLTSRHDTGYGAWYTEEPDETVPEKRMGIQDDIPKQEEGVVASIAK